ncbi:hypothetical protein ACGYLM_15315 [Sulfitobacter sp. 1A10445]|uniref:hypothetical protein n=1 Tax=unclassified Sulfitobacter TaxID=196795 RepID=UPI003746DCEC
MTLNKIQGSAKVEQRRDIRSRDEVLSGKGWANLSTLPEAQTIPLKHLKQADRFFEFCNQRGLTDIQVHHVAAFDTSRSPSSLKILRDTLRSFYGQEHPISHVVEQVRQARCRAYRLQRGKTGVKTNATKVLRISVPPHELPEHWQTVLDDLEGGVPVAGRRISASTAQNMRNYARQLIWSVRRNELPEEISIETLSAYDKDLSQRGLRASSCAFQFGFLRTLASFVQPSLEVDEALRDLVADYKRIASRSIRLKDGKFAHLAPIEILFGRAFLLLEKGLAETHKTKRVTLLLDAAAIAFLTLIPLRNTDTVLRWGEHISIEPSTTDDWVYRIDTSISKTGVDFGGKLHPILNPFLEALLLMGRHPAFLQRRLAEAIVNNEPVFPLSNGGARRSYSLSRRWRARLGTGSHIARTQAHTLLGALGPKGVAAALALCAHRSYATRLHYQDVSLSQALMRQSQKMLVSTLPNDLVTRRMKELAPDILP